MCEVGELLRLAWYSTAVILDGEMDVRRARILEANRRKPEYRIAKAAYIEHIQQFEECRKGWRMR